jgi:hypothetical protein
VSALDLAWGFEVVLFTGNDPDDASSYVVPPRIVPPNVRDAVLPVSAGPLPLTVRAAVRALYVNGTVRSAWTISGTGVVDANTSTAAAAQATADAAADDAEAALDALADKADVDFTNVGDGVVVARLLAANVLKTPNYAFTGTEGGANEVATAGAKMQNAPGGTALLVAPDNLKIGAVKLSALGQLYAFVHVYIGANLAPSMTYPFNIDGITKGVAIPGSPPGPPNGIYVEYETPIPGYDVVALVTPAWNGVTTNSHLYRTLFCKHSYAPGGPPYYVTGSYFVLTDLNGVWVNVNPTPQEFILSVFSRF